jgi:hypothetical protein
LLIRSSRFRYVPVRTKLHFQNAGSTWNVIEHPPGERVPGGGLICLQFACVLDVMGGCESRTTRREMQK